MAGVGEITAVAGLAADAVVVVVVVVVVVTKGRVGDELGDLLNGDGEPICSFVVAVGDRELARLLEALHYGTKPGHFET